MQGLGPRVTVAQAQRFIVCLEKTNSFECILLNQANLFFQSFKCYLEVNLFWNMMQQRTRACKIAENKENDELKKGYLHIAVTPTRRC